MDTGKRFPIPDADRNPKGYLRLEKRRKETSGGGIHKGGINSAQHFIGYQKDGQDLELAMIGPHENYWLIFLKYTTWGPGNLTSSKSPFTLATRVPPNLVWIRSPLPLTTQ